MMRIDKHTNGGVSAMVKTHAVAHQAVTLCGRSTLGWLWRDLRPTDDTDSDIDCKLCRKVLKLSPTTPWEAD